MLWALISTDMIEGRLASGAGRSAARRHLQTLLGATFVTGGGDRYLGLVTPVR